MLTDSVTVAFELMTLELNTAVEDLNSEGARQFHRSSYEETARVSEKGKALRDFCNRVRALADEWTELFAEKSESPQSSEAEQAAAKKILSASKSSKTGLMVRFPDNTLICESVAAQTMAKAIKKIGFEKVAALNVSVNGENLVSRSSSPRYGETFLDGFYVKTHSSTEQKRKHLERISDKLGLGLEISIIL